MVTFISQCEKNSLKKTRRVLDAFANRIGNNTWQTVITQAGLMAIKKLLRKTASKNTAVSCHWFRSRSRSELVWFVGRRNAFDEHGRVPVNSTSKPWNYAQESDWHYLSLIQSLAGLAALFHDWGKASELFQKKLQPKKGQSFKGDPIRHEWISCLLLQSLVQQHATENKDDAGWLSALINNNINETNLKSISSKLINEKQKPLANLPPAAKLVAWLVVSHHRLPCIDVKMKDMRDEPAKNLDNVLGRINHLWGYQNRYDEEEFKNRLESCFTFPKGLLGDSKRWASALKKWASKLLACQKLVNTCLNNDCYRVILHHARLCLMLGDHHYSSKAAMNGWPNITGLFANTDPKNNTLKQKLDEHLIGVAQQAVHNAWLLPVFENEPPVAHNIASLKKKSPPAFAWQDKAVTKIKQLRSEHSKHRYGFFVVNMASTGQGKTFANAKIMRALSDDGNSLRYVLALGLRTLTLQTGDEYRDRIGLDSTELAVLIGSRAVMELHHGNLAQERKNANENSGSESYENLLDEDIDFDCALPEDGLSTVLQRKKDYQFLYAPVLACTIDHLIAATETRRGGRYILPALRLLSSDLVIDEVDDFTGSDLIAIGRLIHLAGMLGRKVMISSATIPPDLAEGYFKAYRDGWQLFCKTRNASTVIGCAWVDEFQTQICRSTEQEIPKAIGDYRREHTNFVDKRIQSLRKVPVKRRADIISCQKVLAEQENKEVYFFELIAQASLDKHDHHHTIDNKTNIAVSFGLVRTANISPCVKLTQYLLEKDWPEDCQVRVMAYHSQQILLLRHQQEKHLDSVLKRKEKIGKEPEAFKQPIIRKHLDSAPNGTRRVLFVVVATPVEEVGRDHDFDWAVVEPSSYRSIIQLAGRVVRHRNKVISTTNISLLEYNLKGIKNHQQPEVKVFNRPGYEDLITLSNHSLMKLVDVQAISDRLDAAPRIQKPPKELLTPESQLSHLEHEITHRLLTCYRKNQIGPETLQGYLSGSWYLTGLPQTLTPFRAGPPSLNIFRVYKRDTATYCFCEKDNDGEIIDRENTLNIQISELSPKAQARLWLVRDYPTALAEWAEETGRSRFSASLRFGELNFDWKENNMYVYNDQLGLVKSG